MWRSQLGQKEVKTITSGDDDDWETDPDFVVCGKRENYFVQQYLG